MKNIASTFLVTILALGLMALATSPSYANADDQGDRCSLKKSAGRYSMTDNGTVVGVGPRTAVGVFKLDGKGNLTDGVAASSLNGSVANETFIGTYTVNPDCSGSASAQIYSGGVLILQLTAFIAFDDDMKEMRMLFTSVSLPDGTVLPSVINLEARKQ
jgi:hypothetical protein